MLVLIANPGSTSYKCKLIDTDTMDIRFQAAVERIGEPNGMRSYTAAGGERVSDTLPVADYTQAVHLTLEPLRKQIDLNALAAVGFKTVLARGVSGCVELTDAVLDAMREYLPLAPVHNAVYLTAISVFEKLLPSVPRIGLFETAFHAQIPLEAAVYGVPYAWIERHGVRKYGFHGASHRYVAGRVQELFAGVVRTGKIISCHLGGSSSVCAIRNGVSADTSMGMSPQCGVLNAKRVGDLDPFALLYVMEKENLSIERMREILITRSGVYGISELSGDFRDIEAAMDGGNRKAELAFKAFAYSVKRYIGEYVAVLNGADVVVFTGGLGQNSARMRKAIAGNMDALGIRLDDAKNRSNPKEGCISADGSPTTVAVVPTDEERIVAKAVAEKLEAG